MNVFMGGMLEQIKNDYTNSIHIYEKLCVIVKAELEKLIDAKKIILSVPMQTRVKELSSIVQKIERKNTYTSLDDMKDLAGLRIITVFKEDVDKIRSILEENFVICTAEDVSSRLKENQFGYSSMHFEITLKDDWCIVPSLNQLRGKIIEVQVRTTAQHIWAAASHVLQYKSENNVPKEILRSVNRVAALLELVDLEFTRVLDEKNAYIKSVEKDYTNDNIELNVENLRAILYHYLPNKNAIEPENYDEMLKLLIKSNINDTKQLISVIERNIKQAIIEEQTATKNILEGKYAYLKNIDYLARAKTGISYRFEEFLKCILMLEIGSFYD